MNEIKSQTWMCLPQRLEAFADTAERISSMAAAEIADEKSAELAGENPGVLRHSVSRREGSKAVIGIQGILLQSVPRWMEKYVAAGYVNVTGMDAIIRAVTEAAADETVTEIVLDTNSPGGSAAGCLATAQAIAAAAQVKPVTAVVGSLAASAAYYMISQATRIEVTADAEIGSIGTFAVYADYTELDKKMGVRMVVIRSGEHKGMGWDGITDTQIAAVQEVIDGLAGQFMQAVAAGRGLPIASVKKLATGQVWLGTQAITLGLADTVSGGVFSLNNERKKKMEEKEKQQQADDQAAIESAKAEGQKLAAERLSALTQAFPDDLAFANEQFIAGSSVTEAKAAYSDRLAEKVRALEGENQQLKQAADAEKKKAAAGTADGVPGVASASDGQASSGGFIAAAKEMASEKKIPIAEAMRKVAADNPALYADYVAGCSRKKVKDED